MNKTILTVVLINIGITLLLPALDDITGGHKFRDSIALTGFGIGSVDVMIGIVLIIVQMMPGRSTAAARGFFLSAAFLVVVSLLLFFSGLGADSVK